MEYLAQKYVNLEPNLVFMFAKTVRNIKSSAKTHSFSKYEREIFFLISLDSRKCETLKKHLQCFDE